MVIVLWFIGGLILAAAISYGAMQWYRVHSEKEEPLPAEKLPKDWDSVMPRAKPKDERKSAPGSEPSFRKVGVRKGSGTGPEGKR
jgi:hypothetical protein